MEPVYGLLLNAIEIRDFEAINGVFDSLFEKAEERITIDEDLNILQRLVTGNIPSRLKPKRLEIFEMLLQSRNFDPKMLTSSSQTLFHLLCLCMPSHSQRDSEENHNIAKALLKNDASVNHRDDTGKTALMLACESKCKDMVQSLIHLTRECGIHLDIDAVDNSGNTTLMIAERNDSESVYLLKELQISQRQVFLNAVRNLDKDFVRHILENALSSNEKFVQSFHGVSYCNAQHWTSNPEYTVDVRTWKEAMHIAIEKSSEDMLKLLIDYDIVVQYQEKSTGDTILHWLFKDMVDDDCNHMPLIEALLKSGKINPNAINFKGKTALALMTKYEFDDIALHATSLFLRLGLNANLKDKRGKTLLAMSSAHPTASIIRAILKWSEDTGTWLDLDARDLKGRTALMKAVTSEHAEITEMLLNAGTAVNLSDNRDFTALHYALHCASQETNVVAWVNFGYFPKNYEELEKRKAECNQANEIEYKEDKIKIIEMLLNRPPGIDVNGLGCGGYSPMDLAEASISEIPSSLREALKQKGATLNVFKPKAQSVKVDFDSGRENFLHRFVHGQFCRDKIDSLNKPISILRELASERDQKGRTPLHCGIINCLHETPMKGTIQKLISLSCSVNETDIYGRTPLHYAKSRKLQSMLVKSGADPTIKDKEEISAAEMAKMLEENNTDTSDLASQIISIAMQRVDKFSNDFFNSIMNWKLESLHDFIRIKWCPHWNQKTISERLWKFGAYAYQHPSANAVKEEVKIFIEDVAIEITRRDPRFEARVILVGSSYEASRIGLPDEFDFNFVLTKFSKLCEVLSSPELPTGFVYVKRKQSQNVEEEEREYQQNSTRRQQCRNSEDEGREFEYSNFFDEDGFLITEKINSQFKIILTNVLADPLFIKRHCNFDWNWHACFDMVNFEKDANLVDYFSRNNKLATTLKLMKMCLDRRNRSSFMMTSVDLVPAIHIDGWWPDEAISNVSEDIKAFGCHLVYDNSQRLYPWVPVSKSCARISFSPAECETIKRSSYAAKQAYMIAKQLIAKQVGVMQDELRPISCYILKTCFLYAIEAFSQTHEIRSESGLSPLAAKTNFQRLDYHFWLESLMKYHLDFVLQEFCPCYFMPSFCMPNYEHFKADAFQRLHYLDAYRLHRCVSSDTSDNYVTLPRLSPIWAHLDRHAMIKDLYDSALSHLEKESADCDFGSEDCDDNCKFDALRKFVISDDPSSESVCETTERPKVSFDSTSQIIYKRF